MRKSKVIAITGPAGSGKSTVASELARKLSNSVNIEVDLVKHMIVSGFVYGEEPSGVEQWHLLGKNIGMLAQNFQSENYIVIINGYINVSAWGEILKFVSLDQKFLLLPKLETIIERDAGRDHESRMEEEAVRRHYKYFSEASYFKDFEQIDSTNLSIEQTTTAIQKAIS